jgi:hypothetical protein
MNVIHETDLELFADYFQFYIQDENASGYSGDIWTDHAIKIMLATADGTIAIGTVRNMVVPVYIRILSSSPEMKVSDDENEIGLINECDLKVSSGQIVIAGCTDYFPEAKRIKLNAGLYRVRVYYFNLDKLSENGLEGKDLYEVQLWPAESEQETRNILRSFIDKGKISN